MFVSLIIAVALAAPASQPGSAPAPGMAEPAWSLPINGLQARLILKRVKVFNGTPIISTFIELRNVSDPPEDIHVRWASTQMKYRVLDANGAEMRRPVTAMYSGPAFMKRNLLVPKGGMGSIDASGCGYGVSGDKAGHIDLWDCLWVFDGSTKLYYLHAVWEVTRQEDEQQPAWQGKMVIPPATIPLKAEPLSPEKAGPLIAELGRKMLDKAHYAESEAAAGALSLIDDPRVIPWYVKAMDTDSYALKFAAIDRLSRIKGDQALEGLKKGMATQGKDIGYCTTPQVASQSAEQIRLCAAQALGRSPHPEAKKLLLSMGDDPYDGVRITVVQALGEMKTEESLQMLKIMSHDASERVRNEALRYLSMRQTTRPATGK